jgi:hypothetical protein
MQNLLRKTSELFWQCPILWLPVLIADIVQFFLPYVRGLIVRESVKFFAYGPRSVLGGAPDLAANIETASSKVLLLAVPLTAGTYLLSVCFYSAALFTIYYLIQDCLHGRSFELRVAVSAMLKLDQRRILILSTKILVLFACGSFLFVSLIAKRIFPLLVDFGYVFGVALVAGIAYLLAPTAIAALQSSQPVSTHAIANARTLAVLGSVASSAIGWLAQKAQGSFFTPSSHPSILAQQSMALIASLFVALPYVPISIALSLIATGPSSYQEKPELENG